MYVFFGSEMKNHNGQFLNIWSPNDNSLGHSLTPLICDQQKEVIGSSKPRALLAKRSNQQSIKSRFHLFVPMSDQDRTSPYNIDTISSRQLMRKNQNGDF